MSATRRDFLKTFGLTAAALATGAPVLADAVAPIVAAAPAIEAAAPSVTILTIRALNSNLGTIFIAPTKELAKDRTKALALRPGEIMTFDCQGMPSVFFDVDIKQDKADVCFDTYGGGGGGRVGEDGGGGGKYIQARVIG